MSVPGSPVLSAYLFFDGNCREAVEFYSRAFGVEIAEIMTYGKAPGADPASPDADRVLHATLAGLGIMASDRPSGTPHVVGDTVSLTLMFADAEVVRRAYDALADGGEANMPLTKTFFSDLFGMVTDRYGVIWQLGTMPVQP